MDRWLCLLETHEVQRLTLQRHATSDAGHPGLPDHQRPLNHRGQRAARAMAGWAVGALPSPDLLLVSTARRTRETAAPLIEAFGLVERQVCYLDQLYLADPATLWSTVLNYGAEAHHPWLIAHNPGVSYVQDRLCGASMPAMVTGAVAHFLVASDGSKHTTWRREVLEIPGTLLD